MKVRKDLKVGTKYGSCYFVKGMEKFLDKNVEATLGDDGLYVVKEDENSHGWDIEMFVKKKVHKK